MYRISAIIEDAFREFLPLAEKRRVGFDIDFPDPTLRVERPSLVRNPLNEQLKLAIERAEKRVSLAVSRVGIVIRDDGVALSPSAARELASGFENVTVKSRVGFGTEVRIKF
ncbi:hypothetical protein IJG98_00240 [Candidatus Saccharibacteria bacterium]|nr:hypothetical protein [Candidatus Saccharibacteria bacterium]